MMSREAIIHLAMDDEEDFEQSASATKAPRIRIMFAGASARHAERTDTRTLSPDEDSARRADTVSDAGPISQSPLQRSGTRKKKILWQHSAPEPSVKVQYVNVANAPSISPRSDSEEKGNTVSSAKASPVGSGSDAMSDSGSDFSQHSEFANLDRKHLPLLYQVPGSSPAQSRNTSIKMKLPRRSADNLQSLEAEQPQCHLAKNTKVRLLLSAADPVSKSELESEELPQVQEAPKTEEELKSPPKRLVLVPTDPRRRAPRSTF